MVCQAAGLMIGVSLGLADHAAGEAVQGRLRGQPPGPRARRTMAVMHMRACGVVMGAMVVLLVGGGRHDVNPRGESHTPCGYT